MNADNMNRWLTLVANISVVAGIIFLAVETRQNTESLDESRNLAAANAYQARAFFFASQTLANAHSPEMVEALVSFRAAGGQDQVSEALATLSPQDQSRVQSVYQARYALYDNNYYQFRNGYLDESRYQSVDAQIIKTESPVWDVFGFGNLETPEMKEEINRLRNQ